MAQFNFAIALDLEIFQCVTDALGRREADDKIREEMRNDPGDE